MHTRSHDPMLRRDSLAFGQKAGDVHFDGLCGPVSTTPLLGNVPVSRRRDPGRRR